MKIQHNTTDILLPPEAAYVLGITQELLFSYTRVAAKKNDKNNVRLKHTAKNGNICFLRSELIQFNTYLHEPWSATAEERPPIPKFVETFLRIEGGGQCARCGKGHKVTTAHITPYAETRSHHHHNLIRLCTGCHSEYDDGLIDRAEITRLKEELIGKTRQRLIASAPKEQRSLGRVPNAAALFVGRGEDVKTLAGILRESRSVSVEGAAGIGKTQLLIQALQCVGDQITSVWIDVEACPNVSDLQLALCVSLSTSENPLSYGTLFRHLDQLDVRIVFDGVEKMSPSDTDELHDFFRQFLAMTSKPRVVFSSQVELADLGLNRRFQVRPIDAEAGRQILLASLPVEDQNRTESSDALNWLTAFCEGHALSLTLAASLLRYFKSSVAVVKRIKEAGSSVLQSPGRQKATPETSLRACLRVSYETLSPSQRRILWFVSHCPAGCLVAMLSEIFKIPDVEVGVAELRRWHLIDVYGVDQGAILQALSPIRAFVAAEWESEQKEAAEESRLSLVESFAIQAAVLNFNHLQAGNAIYALIRFDQEFANFLHAFRLAVNGSRVEKSYLEFIPLLSTALMPYLFVRGFSERGYSIMRTGAQAAVQLGQPRRASNLLVQAFSLAQRSHNPELEAAAANELAKLADGASDHEIQANASMAQGCLATEAHQWDQALTHFENAEHHYTQIEEEPDSEETDDHTEPGSNNNLTMVLMGKARIYEKTDRPAEALPILEHALELVRKANDEVNIGSILHHIGNCAANSSQFEHALEAFIAAAEQFRKIGMAEYLSTALSEMGHLLIEWDPPKPIVDFLSEDLLEDALQDLANQTAFTFSQDRNVTNTARSDVVRKMFGITALSSFSYNHLLGEWSTQLTEEVLRPGLERISESQPSKGPKIYWMYLDLTLALARTLALVPAEGDSRRALTEAEIKHYAWLCYKFFDWGWEAFHPFEWLSTYLRRHRGSTGYSASSLKTAAIAEAERREGI